MATHKLTLWPLGTTLEVSEEKSLLQILKDNGVQIKSSCGGVASCRDCIIKVLSGEDHLTPPGFAEIKLLGNVFHLTKERLSCQTKVMGEVTIDISEQSQSLGGDRVVPKKGPPRVATKLRKKKSLPESTPTPGGESVVKKDQAPQRQSQWYKHWEKESRPTGEGEEREKKQGGGRRPRPFRYRKEEGEGEGEGKP
jgi:ferredoxin